MHSVSKPRWRSSSRNTSESFAEVTTKEKSDLIGIKVARIWAFSRVSTLISAQRGWRRRRSIRQGEGQRDEEEEEEEEEEEAIWSSGGVVYVVYQTIYILIYSDLI